MYVTALSSNILLLISSPRISQTILLSYSKSEGTCLLTVLSGWEPLESQCYNGHGLVFNGGQPSAMDDGIVHRPNPNINILIMCSNSASSYV